MSILVNEQTRLIVQGLTGREGSFHAQQMVAYGTHVVAGVTPGKGGSKHEGIPVFDTVADAVRETGANASLIFVPPPYAADAILEAIDAGLPLAVCITERVRIPRRSDMVCAAAVPRGSDTRLIGPNCPGIISPGKCKIGIMPGQIHKPGHVGVVSRSGTLTYEAVEQLHQTRYRADRRGIGIGGDPYHRHVVPRLVAPFVQRRSGNAGHRDDRRNRRECRAAGGRVHSGKCAQAGRRIHCRADGASGPPHGSCRRDCISGRARHEGEIRGHGGCGHPLRAKPRRYWPESRRGHGCDFKVGQQRSSQQPSRRKAEAHHRIAPYFNAVLHRNRWHLALWGLGELLVH